MYPETDIPPSLITQDLLDKVRVSLPEPAEKKLERLIKEYGLNEKLAKQVADSDYSVLFEGVVKESGVPATVIAAFLTETMKALKRDGIAVEKVSDDQLRAIFQGVGAGVLTKEAVSDVFSWFSQHDDKTLRDALDNLGLKMLTQDEIKSLLDRIIAENKESIEKLRGNAFGLIMGLAMKEARGRADPAIVSRFLKERLR
jgi:glutamyl-tRNA(Gln) amidotransferase subunit E